MRALAGVGVLVAVVLGSSLWLGSGRASAGVVGPGVTASSAATGASAIVRSSRLVLGGRVRCTAIVSSSVEAGQSVQVRFVLHNRSRRVVPVFESSWLVLRPGDGTIYDTRDSPEPEGGSGLGLGSGVEIFPFPLRPGKTLRFESAAVRVRWKGPLQITPGCVKALPALSVQVTSPGPPADANAAVAQVVAASGHLLDQCRPQAPGVPVTGQIEPPSGSTPPMSAQCSVSIESEGGFSVAQALIFIPSSPGFVELWQPYETLWQPGSPPPTLSPPYEAIAWEFVVTQDGATPVAASTMDATYPSDQELHLSYWTGNGWSPEERTGAMCGGSHFLSSGWTGTGGPAIEFISACPATGP